jgi:hypothetical protein
VSNFRNGSNVKKFVSNFQNGSNVKKFVKSSLCLEMQVFARNPNFKSSLLA